MTDEMTQLTEREEIEMLVPFYVTGRISEADARRVDAYLKRNPDFAEHIELVRDERAATVAVNEALGFPSARSADRIFEQISSEPPPVMARARAASGGIMAAVRGFFTAPTPSAVRYAAIAAAAVVLIQAAVVGTMMTHPPASDGFNTASGPKDAAAAGTAALVSFQPTAQVADISRALENAGAKIVEGPVKGGFYKIRIAHDAAGAADAARKLEALKSDQGVVRMLLPSN